MCSVRIEKEKKNLGNPITHASTFVKKTGNYKYHQSSNTLLHVPSPTKNATLDKANEPFVQQLKEYY